MLSRRWPILVRLCHHQASSSCAEQSVETLLADQAKKIQKLSDQVSCETNIQRRKFAEWQTAIRPTMQKIINCFKNNRRNVYYPVIVGSAMTGIANPALGSDVDMVLLSSLCEEDLERSRIAITSNPAHSKRTLGHAISALKNNLSYKQKEFVARARHPIAKLEFQVHRSSTPLILEISIDSMVNVRNSLFIHHCLQVDSRVHMLYYWAKQWLQRCDLIGSQNGKFSSYHTALLVIHFLQYRDHLNMKPVLPLMMECYKHDLAPDLKFRISHEMVTSPQPLVPQPKPSENEMSIGELIVRFVDFYSRVDFCDFTLHIPSGTNVERVDENYEFISMVDPYSNGESVCRVQQGVGKLSEVFEMTMHAFNMGAGFRLPFSFKRE